MTLALVCGFLFWRIYYLSCISSLVLLSLVWGERGGLLGWKPCSASLCRRQRHPRVTFPSWRRHREAHSFLHSWSFVYGWKLCSSWGGRRRHAGAPRRRFRSWILDGLLCTSESSHFLVARAPEDNVSVIPVKAVAWSSNPTYSLAARERCFKPRTFHFFLCQCLLFFFPLHRCGVVLLSCASYVSG
jgi:hypothetical protein